MKRSLIVTIQTENNPKANAGKTTLQYLLAEFLTSRGHDVSISETEIQEGDFRRIARHHPKNLMEDEQFPMKIHIEVNSRTTETPDYRIPFKEAEFLAK